MFPLQELNPKSLKKRQRTSRSENYLLINEEEGNESKLRKTMHRDIERQRRQEMAALYASLRDLLPIEYIKGKRSISEHMHGAVSYIKRMEASVEELKKRRDQLKSSSSSSAASENGSPYTVSWPNCVTVNSRWDGVEILINCGIREIEGSGFYLSRVVMELLQTQLDVVSCISTKVDQRILYTIQSQVNTVPVAYINLSELQERLANVIN